MIQPATLSPMTVAAIPPARAHSAGASPSRILARRARGSAIAVCTFLRDSAATTVELLRITCNNIGCAARWGARYRRCPLPAAVVRLSGRLGGFGGGYLGGTPDNVGQAGQGDEFPPSAGRVAEPDRI